MLKAVQYMNRLEIHSHPKHSLTLHKHLVHRLLSGFSSDLYDFLSLFCTPGLRTKTLKEGGYYHAYSGIDIESFKMETEKRVKELEDSFHRLLKKYEEDIGKAISSFYQK
jgi:hypothetical protein